MGGTVGAILIAGLAVFLTRRHFMRRRRNVDPDSFCIDEEAAKPTPYALGDDGSETDGLTYLKNQSGDASHLNPTRS